MHKPWRHSAFAVAARMMVVLMLLVALITPARETAPKSVHAIALFGQSVAAESSAIRDQLAREIGDTSMLAAGPLVTDFGSAIQDALWEFDPATQGAIILVSDGYWSQETSKALSEASSAQIPVFWLPVLADDSSPGISRLSAPAVARAGETIGVSIDVQLGSSSNAELVLLADDRPLGRQPASESGTFHFLLDVPATGPVILGAELIDAGSGGVIGALKQGALVNIATTPSVLVLSDNPSVFGKSLRDGSWSVLELRPQDLAAQISRLDSVSLLVLDDVAATDLSPTTWGDIDYAVRSDAMGLLVLGGPNSFGLGGYRDSRLESLLPVISEPPEDEAPASLVFLVDVSGSMERPGAVSNRLLMARQATIETAKALRPVDRIGLMTFDVQTRELLRIDSRANHANAIERVWPQSASGGTSLMPSLRQAVAALQDDGATQKLLLLLTDGFLSDEDLQQLDDLLQSTDIELIAMITGDGTQSEFSALAKISEAAGGRAIHVDDMLRLPTLMRHEVETRRPALVSTPSQPRVFSPTVWLPDDAAWPEVEAYLLTRPREEAQVYLVSDRGDVLLASTTAGAGKVFVVTSGFSGWAEKWLQWDQWPEFSAELTGFLATRDTSAFSISVLQSDDSHAALKVKLLETNLPDVFSATLVSPSGSIEAIDLQARSPGELTASLDLDDSGQYTVVVEADTVTARHRFLKQSAEYRFRDEPPIARRWLNDGLLRLWDAEALRNLEPKTNWREWLVGLALFVFLLTLVAERLWSRLRRRSYN